MYKLFEYLFITRKYKNENGEVIIDNKVRTSYGTLTSVLGIVCNLILCSIKIIAGILASSISILSDGINNLTDSTASLTTLVGFRLASQPADEDHPFGHERIEYICGMIISVFILVVGVLLGKSSIEKIISKEEMDVSKFWLLFGILLFSIVLKLWMGFMYSKAAKKINSLTIKASSQDSFNDSISTIAVLVSLVLAYAFGWNLDAYLGLGVSIFILVNGVKTVKETMSPLIGEATKKEDVANIVSKIKSFPGVLGIHDLVVHQYGPNKMFVTIHIEVDRNVDVMVSHELMDDIERYFKDNEGIELTAHLDPIEVDDTLTSELKEIVASIVSSKEFLNFHDFRIVKGERNVNVLFDVVNPYKTGIENEDLIAYINEEFINKTKDRYDYTFHLIINVDRSYLS